MHRSKLAAALLLATVCYLYLPSGQAQPTDELDSLDQQLQQLYQSAHYQEAIPLAERYIALAEAKSGVDHPHYATGISWLGLLEWAVGHYAKAEPLLARALAIDEKALGPEDTDLARDYNNLASFYQEEGRFADAEPPMKRALAIDEKVLGLEDVKVGRDCNNLGLMYREQGRFAEAEPLFQRALAITEKALGPENRSVAIRLRNLAALDRDLGRYQDAEPLLERAISIDEKVLGVDHPDVADGMSILARVYRDTARYDDAERLDKRALEIREQRFGRDSIKAAVSLNDLSILYQSMGRNSEALLLARRGLALREQVLGSNHPDVAVSTFVLGGIQENLGNLAEAEQLYRQALSIQEKILGPEHPDLARTRGGLGGLLKSQGRYREAQPLLESALAIREKVLGPNHPLVASSLLQLSELYRLQGRFDDAEKLFNRARGIRKSGLQEVPIFFATDRKKNSAAKSLTFGDQVDLAHVTFGLAKVAVLRGQTTSQRGDPKQGGDDNEITDVGRITIQSLDEIKEQRQFVDAAQQKLRAAEAFKNQALLYVHGYNVSFENAVCRAAQIAYDLNFDGPVFVFGWPSHHNLFSYFTDRDTVDIATEHLKEFFQKVVAETHPLKLHLVAHSMGNLVLIRAVGDGSQQPAIGEIVDAAPDVAPDVFSHFATKIKATGANITIYASAADKALWVSGWFRDENRVGYISKGRPILVSGAETIDITNAGDEWFALNHDVYASSPIIISDMRRIFEGERPPDRRTKDFIPVVSPQGTYWRYVIAQVPGKRQ